MKISKVDVPGKSKEVGQNKNLLTGNVILPNPNPGKRISLGFHGAGFRPCPKR